MSKVMSVNGLNYSVSNANILNNLSLHVAEGNYYAIAGINGAGKSTLIKLILDLIRPSSGQIEIFGIDNQVDASRHRIGYLPEKFDIKKAVTGQQYLKFVCSMYRLEYEISVVEQLCSQLDFPVERLRSNVRSYSKGMIQKLGLISCFILDRDLLILDEPLSGLDPKARYDFKQLLREEKDKGHTILYSTHMLADAEEVCDQFGILHRGEMKFVGTPEECRVNYGGESLEQAYINCIDR